MKKFISFSIFLAIVVFILLGANTAYGQRVIITRSTVLLPTALGNPNMYANGYWKWSPRFQKYIWVAHPRARLRVHRGYRVRI